MAKAMVLLGWLLGMALWFWWVECVDGRNQTVRSWFKWRLRDWRDWRAERKLRAQEQWRGR